MGHVDQGCHWNLGIGVDLENDLYKFIRQLKLGAPCKDKLPPDRTITHSLFDGILHGVGVLSVVDKCVLHQLYVIYAHQWNFGNSIPLYFNELSSTNDQDPRPLCFDFDFYFPGHVPAFDLTDRFSLFFITCQTCMANVVAPSMGNDLQLIVGSGGLTHATIKDTNEKQTKLGLHLVWPDLNVTRSGSLAARRALITMLIGKFGETPTIDDNLVAKDRWIKILDASPLSSNPQSLRMFGSRKLERSGQVKPRVNDGAFPRSKKPCMCPPERHRGCMCFKGRVRDAGRQLIVAAVYTGTRLNREQLVHYENNKADLLIRASLQPHDRVLTELAIANDYMADKFKELYGETKGSFVFLFI